MNHALIGFMGGLLAFPHCIGMCGGFIVHLSRAGGKKRAIAAQSAWLTGKIFTYAFAGAVAGYAGNKAATVLQHTYLQNGISYLAGGMILLAGLALLGLLPAKGISGPGSGLLVTLCRPLLQSPSPAGALTLGIITGLLPCPVVIGFLAYAMQSGSVTTGMVTMAAMGIGTTLPLLALGGASLAAGARLKKWSVSAGGIILLLLGMATVLRGTVIFHQFLGCPTQPVYQQAANADGKKDCCSGKPHAGNNGN